jgi:hypothetical protein
MKKCKCGDRSVLVCVGEKRLITALYAAAGMLLAMCDGDSAFDRRLEQGLLSIAEELKLHAEMIIELVRIESEDTGIGSMSMAANDLSEAIDEYENFLELRRRNND